MSERQRLPKRTVLRHLAALEHELSPRQRNRLLELADRIDDNRRIRLSDALDIVTQQGADTTRQATFRKFRAAFGDATRQAGLGLELAVDSLKTHPQERFCWFEGPDTVISELAEISGIEARAAETGGAIVQKVAELFDPRDIRLYVSAHRAARKRDGSLIGSFLELLEENLAARTDLSVTIADSLTATVGDKRTDTAARVSAADVVLVLLNAGYLRYNRDEFLAVLTAHRTVGKIAIFVAVDDLPDNPDLHGLSSAQILWKRKPFATHSPSGRFQFVRNICETLVSHLNQPAVDPVRSQRLLRRQVVERLTDYNRHIFTKVRFSENRIIESRADETPLEPETDPNSTTTARPTGETCVAVDRLVEWALDNTASARRWCALLGDTGIGKTTASRLLTARLLMLRDRGVVDERDRPVPLPIYFDLRDLPVDTIGASPNITEIFEALLAHIDVAANRPSAEEVLRTVQQGKCIVIFDGLDETLVHLTPVAGQAFTRTLWRALERPLSAHHYAGGAPSKLLISCRTHYFRSIRHEITHFTDKHRDGPSPRDYLTLLMLPFSAEQIRAYLVQNVPGSDVDSLMRTISDVHNLREMAERPFMLKLISEQLPFVERAARAGQTVRPADLYHAFTNRWLERDDDKHTLLHEHKLLLMEHLAAELWRSGRSGWSAADVEQWLIEFIAARPDLAVNYRTEASILKEDLRTATFLIRRGDDQFGFAHTSLREYFVARYLLNAVQLGPEKIEAVAAAWSMPVPSVETLDFLGQCLAGLNEQEQLSCVATLRGIRDEYRPQASELAFAYALRAEIRRYPSHSPARSVLDGADLTRWTIGYAAPRRLNLRSLSLRGAKLHGVNFTNVDMSNAVFEGSDLTRAEITEALLRNTRFDGADLTGTAFRKCNFVGSSNARATTYRTQVLLSELGSGNVWQAPTLLVAACTVNKLPMPAPLKPDGGEPDIYSGRTGPVRWATYAGNGSRILTTGSDDFVRIWDARTTERLFTFKTNAGPIKAVSASPDERHILTIGSDGSARIWDAHTGEHVGKIRDSVKTAAYRPDGLHILTIGSDGSVDILESSSGTHISTLIGHIGPARSAAYSPDSRYVMTTGADHTVRLWDARTGEHLSVSDELDAVGHHCSFEPKGNAVLVIDSDRRIRIFELSRDAKLTSVVDHDVDAVWGSYSPDGRTILATGADGKARTLDADTGEPLLTFPGKVSSIEYSPDGRHILTAVNDEVMIWDTHTKTAQYPLISVHGQQLDAAFGMTDNEVVTVAGDGTVAIWNSNTARLVHTFDTPPGTGRHRVVNQLTAVKGTAKARILGAHSESVRHSIRSPDGLSILTIDSVGAVRTWDMRSGQLLFKLDRANSARYSPDSETIVTCGLEPSAVLWDASTGRRMLTLTGHRDRVLWAAYSPDGGTILTTSADGTGRISKADTGTLIATLVGHAGKVLEGAYSVSGRQVLTTGDDATARVWDAAQGKELFRITALPLGNHVVHREQRLAAVSSGAWRYLGWSLLTDGVRTRLPAETFGPLPELS